MDEDIKEVKKIVARSGNSFHFKVLKIFEELGWKAIISPYYTDNLTSKSREIDLIAEKAFDIQDTWGKFFGTVNVQFFIECKYIIQKTVFWFHEKNRVEAEKLVTRNTPFKPNNMYTNEHHYLEGKEKVAKLFADEKKRNAENEVFYKALNQSLNALIYYRGSGSILNLKKGYNDYVKCILSFPLIICNSFENIYKIDLHESEEPKKVDKNFQLEVNYAYVDSGSKNHNEYFLLDIVSFELLKKYLDKIKKDTDKAGIFLR